MNDSFLRKNLSLKCRKALLKTWPIGRGRCPLSVFIFLKQRVTGFIQICGKTLDRGGVRPCPDRLVACSLPKFVWVFLFAIFVPKKSTSRLFNICWNWPNVSCLRMRPVVAMVTRKCPKTRTGHYQAAGSNQLSNG